MPTLTTFLIASLATYYLARCISDPHIDGPWGIFTWLRDRFVEDDWKGRGIRCIVCVSCWTALAAALGMGFYGLYDLSLWPIVWLGLAGGSVVIERYWKR